MIGPGAYLAFLGVSLLVICTPGQDTALTIRNTLLGRRRAGVATAFGVAVGQGAWTLATSAGLAVVLASSGPLFLAIRLAGAAYLIYLGARSLAGAVFRRQSGNLHTVSPESRLSPCSALLQGVVSNLSNAKMVAFFLSLLPQFAGPHPGFASLLALGLTFCVLTFVWLVGYAFAVEWMSKWLRMERIRRVLDGLLGAVLVGLGWRVTSQALAR